MNEIQKLARTIWAMNEARKGKADLATSMENERYQRTFTDEHFPGENVRAGFRRVPNEQKREWQALAGRNEQPDRRRG